MRASARVEVQATPARLLEVITDFEAYPEFIEDLISSRVVAHSGTSWEVGFVISVVRPLAYTLRLVQQSGRDGVRRLTWTLIQGPSFRVNEGSWEIRPTDEGCEATYRIDLQLALFVPTTIMNSLTRERLPGLLQAFKERAESTPGALAGSAPVDG